MRETLETVERMTGKMPQEGINPVEMPFEIAYLWQWFIDLNSARGSAGMVPSPITYLDMHAYFTLTGINPQPWEISAIRRLDHIALTAETKDETK